MFHHILVPLDGSSRAEQALPVAAQVARASGGTITLLQAVNNAYDVPSYGLRAVYVAPHAIEDDLASARRYLDSLRQRSDLVGVSIRTQAVLGNPAVVIIDQIVEQPTDLVILSSHGYTGVKRWMMGSIAEKVARHATVPVLILRAGEPLRIHQHTDDMRTARALVPLDTSARALDAIVPAANLVAALSTPGQGELHFTQMVVVPDRIKETEKASLLQLARQNLDAIGQSIRDGRMANFDPDLHLALSWSASLDSDIAEGIVRIAEDGEASAESGTVARSDFIAMTTHGSSGIQRWNMGSIVERVLYATRLPVLIVRPADMLSKERR